ncbi:MAG: N-acetyltransferase [Clostridia bacterium]
MHNNNYSIRLETPADYPEVEALTREAFWNVYHPGCSEHYVLHYFCNREDFVRPLDFVMEKDGEIIGHIMYVWARILADNSGEIPIMTFGLISIAPSYQRRGYGQALLAYSIKRARLLGVCALCIERNIAFYGKSGFVVASTRGIHYYAAPREAKVPCFLLKELQDGFLNGITGTYHTPAGYFTDEKVTKKFDALFPPKAKLKLPGQLA